MHARGADRARATAEKLKSQGTTSVSLRLDDTLFTGAQWNEGWESGNEMYVAQGDRRRPMGLELLGGGAGEVAQARVAAAVVVRRHADAGFVQNDVVQIRRPPRAGDGGRRAHSRILCRRRLQRRDFGTRHGRKRHAQAGRYCQRLLFRALRQRGGLREVE